MNFINLRGGIIKINAVTINFKGFLDMAANGGTAELLDLK